MSPTIWPSATSKETPSSATIPPKRTVRSRTARIGCRDAATPALIRAEPGLVNAGGGSGPPGGAWSRDRPNLDQRHARQREREAKGQHPVASRLGPIRLELLESLALLDRAQLRRGRILWGAEPLPHTVTVAMARVDASVAHADSAAERQPRDRECDLGLTRSRRVLVVGVPPHEHAHAVAARGGG